MHVYIARSHFESYLGYLFGFIYQDRVKVETDQHINLEGTKRQGAERVLESTKVYLVYFWLECLHAFCETWRHIHTRTSHYHKKSTACFDDFCRSISGTSSGCTDTDTDNVCVGSITHEIARSQGVHSSISLTRLRYTILPRLWLCSLYPDCVHNRMQRLSGKTRRLHNYKEIK